MAHLPARVSAGLLPAEAQEEKRDFVIFQVNDLRYALPLERVTRVVRMVLATPALDQPPWIAGVVNVEGRLLPVVDLRVRLGRAPREPELSDRLIIVARDQGLFCLMADSVEKILSTPKSSVEPAAGDDGNKLSMAHIRDDAGIVTVLNAENILSEPRHAGAGKESGA